MLRKYHITINILFWLTVFIIISMIIWSAVSPETGVISLIFRREEKVIIKKESVIIEEVEKEGEQVEWFYFVATGYSPNDPVQGTNSTTATGEKVFKGIVAVDPDIIPFGTKIEIKELGVFVAEDTGGKIKGNRIDIFFSSKREAKNFGRKEVWIRFLDNNVEIADNLKLFNTFDYVR